MSEVNIEDIAMWIRDDQMTIGQAAMTYNLSKEEKNRLKELLRDLDSEKETLQASLLDDIRINPSAYYAEKMAVLFDGGCEDELLDGDDPFSRFVRKGYILSLSALQEKLNFPSCITKKVICAEDFSLPEYSFKEYEGQIVKTHHTDIYFLGAANCGKSSMTCSVIRELVGRQGFSFEPFGDSDDRTKEYFDAVSSCTRDFYKATASSSADNLLFCQLKDDERRRLTMIDAGRRGFADLSKLQNGKGRDASRNGIYRLLSNDNSKMLFFLIDFNAVVANNCRTLFNQVMTLERAIQALMYDGGGKDGTKDCTMSKVKTLGFLFTKYDIQSSMSKPAVAEKIDSFVNEYMQNLTRTLDDACRQYDINEENENRPYFLPFSLGRFTVGNTLLYNPDDARSVAGLITATCPKQLWWNC